MLLIEQILAIPAHETRPVEIPELGDKVFVRSMSGIERDLYFNQARANKDEGESYFSAARTTGHASRRASPTRSGNQRLRGQGRREETRGGTGRCG